MHKLSAVKADNAIYLVELSPPYERLEFQEVPSELPWERSGNFAEIAVPGRNNPLHQYTGGSDSISIKAQFIADELSGDSVRRDVRWLQSLVANDAYNAPVRRVQLIWGDIFTTQTWVVKAVKASFADFHSDRNYNPMRATVEISLALDTDANRSLTDIRNG